MMSDGGSEEAQATRNILTVYVDGEQVDLAEVEIEENNEIVEEMATEGLTGDGGSVEVHTVEHEGVTYTIDPNVQYSTQQEVMEEDEAATALQAAANDAAVTGKRLLLKDWLVQKLDCEEMPDILSWYNKDEGLFKIKWLHKATDSWEVMADGVLFKQWCIHTGKYDPSNENPRRWKANFRCALNSLPDVIIVPSLCVRKGKDAYRVFKILPEKIPEKVREKQESSRKRRREKRETLLKAYARNQAEIGNIEHAEAINKQIASNPSNIKIQLKRGSIQSGGKKLKIVSVVTEDGIRICKTDAGATTSTGGTTTSGGSGGKTLLNGMDALCTAAAMMADTPGGAENQEGGDQQTTVIETITLDSNGILQAQGSGDGSGEPGATVAGAQRLGSDGDIVTYYHPVGPIHVVNRDGKQVQTTHVSQSATVTTTAVSLNSPGKSTISATTTTSAGTVIPGMTTLPVFRPLNSPVGRLQLGSPTLATNNAGNLVLSVRLPANMSPGLPSAKIIPQGGGNVSIPQITGLPQGVCLTSGATTTLAQQAPAYLIPKNLIQQQIAASAGNQPARVYTVKHGKSLVDIVSSSQTSTKSQKPSTVVSTAGITEESINVVPSEKKSAPALLDQLEYYNLKENIGALDFGKTGFQFCKHSDLIRVIRLYDSDKPSVEMSISINPDYTFNVVIHNRNLSGSHELVKRHRKTIKNVQHFAQLIHRLSEYVTCMGNPEEMAHQQYTDYSSFISAFQEPDFGAKNPVLRYRSTIRSNACHLLVKAPADITGFTENEAKNLFRCDECKRIRTQVLSMRGLFSLIDGPKIPDNEQSRKKRLQLLKECTTKEVLANRVDLLETQIKRYQKLLPSELQGQSDTITLTESSDLELTEQTIVAIKETDLQTADNTSELVASISEECSEGDVQNVIRVALSDQAEGGDSITSRLGGDAGTVYHIVESDGTSTANSAGDIPVMIVTTTGNDSLQTNTEGLLEELSHSVLGEDS